MKKNNRNAISQILIWLGIFAIFFHISNYWQSFELALVSSVFDTISLYIVYQITVGFLFPRFYGNQRKYLLISLGVIVAFSVLYYLIDANFIPRAKFDGHEKPPMILHFMRIFLVNSFTFFIATSVSLMHHNKRLLENEKLLTEEKLKTELKLLKAQINPHFIFNALNNIYSLTYMKANSAPDAVLKLSEMLRYVFYDCSKEQVPVSSEINYIENYIAFQQMKSEHTQNIKLTNDIKNAGIEIAPMLFIPFIENAFKYSRIEEKEDENINIRIADADGKLQFYIENSFDAGNKPIEGSGTGIKNVQHRLNIIYPNKHELNISEGKDKYCVDLNILI
jgi:hypothetical protein